jgi:hypothetical protein
MSMAMGCRQSISSWLNTGASGATNSAELELPGTGLNLVDSFIIVDAALVSKMAVYARCI